MGHIRESWGFSWVLSDMGGNSPRATSEAKAARLTCKGIRVRLSPGPLPRCPGLLSGSAWASSQGWNSGPEFHSMLCLSLLGALVTVPHFPSPSPASCHLVPSPEQHPQKNSLRRQPLCLSLPSPCPLVWGSRLPLSQRLTCLPLRLSHPFGIIILRQPGCSLSSAPWRSELSPPLAHLISLPPLLPTVREIGIRLPPVTRLMF